MSTARTIWNCIATIETLVVLVGIGWTVCLWIRGISPVLLRLGSGLAKRRIAIFAKGDHLASLQSLLTDSKLFRKKNLIDIRTPGDFDKSEKASVFIVWWHDWINDMPEILARKHAECALIVYAPFELGPIPNEQMKTLDGKRHTAVTNFRGRLLNDIVVSMITTSHEEN